MTLPWRPRKRSFQDLAADPEGRIVDDYSHRYPKSISAILTRISGDGRRRETALWDVGGF
jgi:hypothetical protein